MYLKYSFFDVISEVSWTHVKETPVMTSEKEYSNYISNHTSFYIFKI